MSWAPSLMSADPDGGSRWTISRPVSSKCWRTSSSNPMTVSLAEPAEDRFPLAQPLVEPVDRARHRGQGGVGIAGPGGAGRVGRRPHRLHRVDQGEVEVVDPPESGLVDLHGIEEAGVAALGVAEAGGDAVEALARRLDVVDGIEAPAAADPIGHVVERLLVALQPAGEELALQAVGVPAQPAPAVAPEAGDRARQPL